MDFLTYVNEHRQVLIDELKELLRIPSVLDRFDPESTTPFGKGIHEALMHMLDRAKKDGFIYKNIHNYAAHIEHGEGDELLGILCHLDVVPPGDGWTHPPFQPYVKDEKIFARGSMDDKGPTIAAYYALKFLKDLNVPFYKRVRIVLGTDEESGWRGIKEYFKTEEMPAIGFAPDASFPLIYGEKGFWTYHADCEFQNDELLTFESGERYNVVPDYAVCTLSIDLSKQFEAFLKYHGFKGEMKGKRYVVHGKNAHAMHPNLGVNAAFILADFLKDHLDNSYINAITKLYAFDPYGEKFGIDFSDKEMKDFTINPGIFKYNETGGFIGVNCRYPKGFNLDKAIEKTTAKLSKLQLSYKFVDNIPIHYVDVNDPLIKTLMDAYQKITNDMETKPFTIGGGTYARALDKAVAFGMVMPGRKDVAHQVDEHIFIDDLIDATAIYMEAIYALTREE